MKTLLIVCVLALARNVYGNKDRNYPCSHLCEWVNPSQPLTTFEAAGTLRQSASGSDADSSAPRYRSHQFSSLVSIIDSIKQEPQCIEKGGICTILEDCPAGNLAEEQGLCPKQRSQGIECCYGLSVKETRCVKNGGICLPATEFCNPNIIVTRATDCESNQKCCVMVQ